MYDIKKLLVSLSETLNDIDTLNEIPFDQDLPLDVEVLEKLNNIVTQVELVRDDYCDQFSKNYSWGSWGFTSSAQAISTITHNSYSSAKKSLERIEFIDTNPNVRKYLSEGKITIDHINIFSQYFKKDYYKEHIIFDSNHLLKSAEVLSASKFSLLMQHWKYNIDNIDDDESEQDRIERYENRFLNLFQRSNGDWEIEGILDPISGEILSKTLEDIRTKIYRDTNSDKLEFYSKTAANVDAITMLSRGYITTQTSAETETNTYTDAQTDTNTQTDTRSQTDTNTQFAREYCYTPVFTADIIIDIDNINTTNTHNASSNASSNASTGTGAGAGEEFFDKWMNNPTLLSRAHDKKYVEQLLCDSNVTFPIKSQGNIIDLGRSVRSAPRKLKRALAIQNNTCSVDGCNIPTRWCDAHHIKHWINGGETKIENLTLLCQRHHTMTHINKNFEQKLSKHLTRGQLYKKKPPEISNSA